MHAIILAAGRGSRLGGLTDATPKCMMEVAGTPLLTRQVRGFAENGVDVVVVRGYLKECIVADGFATRDNDAWETTGLLTSLFCAEDVMDGGFMISYGDTTFRSSHVKRVLDALADGHEMAGVVDGRWLETYEGRDWHPPAEAENVTLRDDGTSNMAAVGKVVEGHGSVGEYIGLCGVSAAAVPKWKDAYRHLQATVSDRTWGQTGSLRTAYVADLMQHLIDSGESIHTIVVPGGYREIDTPEDLDRAQDAVTW